MSGPQPAAILDGRRPGKPIHWLANVAGGGFRVADLNVLLDQEFRIGR